MPAKPTYFFNHIVICNKISSNKKKGKGALTAEHTTIIEKKLRNNSYNKIIKTIRVRGK